MTLLEEDNCKLKHLVADLNRDKHIVHDNLSKALTPGRWRELVARAQASIDVSEQLSCSAPP